MPGELLELHVRVVAARHLPVHSHTTSFALLRSGAHEARSADCVRGGEFPAYNWKTMLPCEATSLVAVCIVHEGGLLSAEKLIGSCQLSAASLTDGAVADVWLPLKQGAGAKEENAGEVGAAARRGAPRRGFRARGV